MNCRNHFRGFSLAFLAFLLFGIGIAHKTADARQPVSPEPVVTIASHHDFATLVSRLETSISGNGMALIAKASASAGAAKRGVQIPGDAVLLIFRNDFAVRMLHDSVTAGIEAPIPIHVYEVQGGFATVAYRRPSSVFRRYGNKDLNEMAKELDTIFEQVVKQAVKE